MPHFFAFLQMYSIVLNSTPRKAIQVCAVEQYLTVYDKHCEAISARKIGKHKF